MFIDARTLGPSQSFSADLCIVGAGPAGLAIAMELGARSGLKIIIVESGAFEDEAATSALNQGSTVGDPYHDPAAIRARRFAGTATMWHTSDRGSLGTKYLPLDPIDFEKRDWIPYSGWPFNYEHLKPWYERAMKVCGVGPYEYSTQYWSDESCRPWNLDGTDADSAVYQLGPDETFLRDARATVEKMENVRCILNATVVAMETESGPGGRKVTGLKIRTLSGISLSVTAPKYVLATGGIENARLLLAFNIGNQNDQVGRYYNDHPVLTFTEFVPKERALFNRSAFYDRRPFRGVDVLGRLVLKREAMEREKLLNIAVLMHPRPGKHQWRPIEAVRRLNIARHTHAIKPGFYGDLFHAIIGAPWIAAYAKKRKRGQNFMASGWSRWPDNSGEYRTFEPVFYPEQAPDPENRITLGEDRDALGMPRPVIHWRWRDLDRRSASKAAELFGAAFHKVGIGELHPLAEEGFTPGTHHPASTTRMSVDPKLGVVDATGKVHDVANLYVAGASIFPTAGFANPMLTIVAIALRLADHLAGHDAFA
ncbi:MAG TPA: GMC family oxidoreductase [Tepidisphaeraceae bacterium]|jgi:choline dehydrogenase-like flavoprotein